MTYEYEDLRIRLAEDAAIKDLDKLGVTMTQTPKVEKSPFDLFVEAEIAKNGREPHWARRCLELHMRAEFLNDEDEHLRAKIKSLETALKSARELIKGYVTKCPCACDNGFFESKEFGMPDIECQGCLPAREYQDALAKVDVK